jgi:hypothetical protein
MVYHVIQFLLLSYFFNEKIKLAKESLNVFISKSSKLENLKINKSDIIIFLNNCINISNKIYLNMENDIKDLYLLKINAGN